MLFKNTEVSKYISHILILHIRGRWSSQGGAPSVVGGEFRPESSIVLDGNIQDPLILVNTKTPLENKLVFHPIALCVTTYV